MSVEYIEINFIYFSKFYCYICIDVSLYMGFFFSILWLKTLYYYIENEMKLNNLNFLV